MTEKKTPTLNELFHMSRRQNRVTVGGGASSQDITAAIREMANAGQDELPQRRHVAGQHHDLNQLFREALTNRGDAEDDIPDDGS